MTSPSVLGYLLAAVMIVTAVYCVSRLAAARLRGRPTEPDVDIVHVLMGAAMAGMLVPRLRSLPDGVWEAVFGVALAWFGWQAIRAYRTGGRAAHYVPHVLASGAMVYMFLAVSPARTGPALARVAMDGQSAATIRFPALALALALALFGYVMWVTDRLPSVPAVSALRLAPAAAVPVWPGTGSQPGMRTAAAATRRAASGFAEPGFASQDDAGSAPRSPGAPLSPRLAACCEIVMGLTMGYMLIVML
jgi:hypothetical protein